MTEIDRNASASLHTHIGQEFSGATVTEYATAKEAVEAAVAAAESRRFSAIRVWVANHGMIDFPEIDELQKQWA